MTNVINSFYAQYYLGIELCHIKLCDYVSVKVLGTTTEYMCLPLLNKCIFRQKLIKITMWRINEKKKILSGNTLLEQMANRILFLI